MLGNISKLSSARSFVEEQSQSRGSYRDHVHSLVNSPGTQMNIILFPAVAAEWRAQQRSRELWSLRKKRFCNCERRGMQFVFLPQKSPVRQESGFYSVRHSVKKPKVNLPNTAQEHFGTKARKEPFLVCFVLFCFFL